MKCFSYNTLIKIIKKIQTEEKFYNLLFIESHRPGDKIWKHLVDCREIKLSMVPEEVAFFILLASILDRIKPFYFSISAFIPDLNAKEEF